MNDSHMDYPRVEYQLQSVHASLRALIQDVAYGTRGRIASTHLTRALTEVICAMRHCAGQNAIDVRSEAEDTLEGEIVL